MAGNTKILTNTDPSVDVNTPFVTGTTFGAKHAVDVNILGGDVTIDAVVDVDVQQYTEDAASDANPTGPQIMARRRDTPASETTTDGDVTALNSTAKGELYVKHVDVVQILGSVDVTSLDPGTGSTSIAKAEDAVHASGDVGMMALGVRRDTPTATAADGDYIPLTTNSTGKLWANVDGSTLGANSGVDIGDVTINNSSGGSAVNIQDGGNSITVDGSVTVSGTVDTELTTADLDTGGGTDTRAVVGLVGSASGGGQLIPGSSTDGLLVNLGANNDVTVTGTVTANAGTNLNTSALALESGGNLAGAATSLAIIDDWDETDRAKVNPIAGQAGVQGGSGAVSALTQRVVLATDVALPAGNNNIGDVDTLPIPAATPTLSNVAASATSVTLLSANSARRQVVLVNDSASICYVKFGTTASTASYTVQMPAIASGIASHLFIDETPIYTGRIDAIWASATGNMRITEIVT